MRHPIPRISRAAAPARGAVARAAFLAAMFTGVPAAHAAGDPAGYVVAPGGTPLITASGDCVHTSEWRPGMHYEQCNAPAPRTLSSAPAPRIVRAAAPVVRPERPAPKPVSFRLSLDTLFDFDQTALTPRGSALLDTLADRLGHASYGNIRIVGHADPIGSPSYNRRLSERRAKAVKDYLAGLGLDSGKLIAEGAGSSDPVMPRDRCTGMDRRGLLRCLGPDRSAEIEIAGTAPNAAASRDLLSLERTRAAASASS